MILKNILFSNIIDRIIITVFYALIGSTCSVTFVDQSCECRQCYLVPIESPWHLSIYLAFAVVSCRPVATLSADFWYFFPWCAPHTCSRFYEASCSPILLFPICSYATNRVRTLYDIVLIHANSVKWFFSKHLRYLLSSRTRRKCVRRTL